LVWPVRRQHFDRPIISAGKVHGAREAARSSKLSEFFRPCAVARRSYSFDPVRAYGPPRGTLGFLSFRGMPRRDPVRVVIFAGVLGLDEVAD